MYWQRVGVSRLVFRVLETPTSCWRAVKLSGHDAVVVVFVDWRRRREVVEEEERGERKRRRRRRERKRRDIGD